MYFTKFINKVCWEGVYIDLSLDNVDTASTALGDCQFFVYVISSDQVI